MGESQCVKGKWVTSCDCEDTGAEWAAQLCPFLSLQSCPGHTSQPGSEGAGSFQHPLLSLSFPSFLQHS